ncbi:hypothetical protein Vadar_006698 [Vaccinium darrowii]|nr:hypothetical protein Vadar_006698 [Vaccinium darrowii]
MTRKNFENAFNEKYFSALVKQAMLQEFLDLRQGTRTVTQYAALFEELARHVGDLIKTDDAKARRGRARSEVPMLEDQFEPITTRTTTGAMLQSPITRTTHAPSNKTSHGEAHVEDKARTKHKTATRNQFATSIAKSWVITGATAPNR